MTDNRSAPPPRFRAEAAAAATSVSHVDDALEVVRPPVLAFCGVFTLLVVGVLVWATFTEVPINVSGQGILVTPAGVIDVVAESGGRIDEILYGPGDAVKPGDVVARIDQSEQRLVLSQAEGELAGAVAARNEMLRFQQRDLHADEIWSKAREEAIKANIVSQLERQRMMSEREDVIRQLADRGLTARDRAISATIELFTIKAEIESQRNELRTLTLDAARRQTQRERDLLAAEERVDTATRAVTAARDRLSRFGVIISPHGGRVVEAKANVGQVVSVGTPIVSLERASDRSSEAELVALVYVGAQDGKKLRPGMIAEVSPASVRKEEHGHLKAQVHNVADVPASSAGMFRTLQNDALVQEFQKTLRTPFEILIKLDRDKANELIWSTGNPPKFTLDGGNLVTVEITTEKIRLIALAVPILQQWLREDLSNRPAGGGGPPQTSSAGGAGPPRASSAGEAGGKPDA